jgi:hypothetical protein
MTLDQIKSEIQDKTERKMKLENEIWILERQLEVAEKSEQFRDIPECDLDYYGVRGGKCKYGSVYYGRIFCLNPNCKG